VNPSPDLQNELAQRHRTALLVVLGFLVLTLILAAIALWAVRSVTHPGDPGLVMTLWIAILIFGLGALVLRRTRFAAMRLKDIAAVRGASALLKTLQSTTIQIASLGGAIALMGFVITLRTGDWLDMLRAAGVAVIVLIYGYPIKSAWQSAVVMLGPDAG
jgi:hypothetical protein